MNLLKQHKCCICGGQIYPFEKYIENYKGEVMHYDCHFGLTSTELFNWLDIDVNYMDDYVHEKGCVMDELND